MIKTPATVDTSMPQNTADPMITRDTAPAPDASMSGTTPRMNAKAVMRIGRKRSFAASSAASIAGFPCSRCALANSTMRIAFLAARPMSMTRPTWTNTLFSSPWSQMPKKAPKATSGVPSRTAKGSVQLSYIAASRRKTKSTAIRKVGADGGAVFSWYESPE